MRSRSRPGRTRVRPGRVAAPGRIGVLALAVATAGCARIDPPRSLPSGGAEESAIRAGRAAQNEAIREGDFDRVATWWTEDVTIRAGLGFTLNGRAEYRAAFGRDTSVVYVRTPNRIEVSETWPLAWEEGTWVGSRRADGARLISGRYAAQWIRLDDGWKIRSELFVAMDCSGDGCAWTVFPP